MEQGALTPESMIMYQVLTEGAAITAFDLGSSHQVIGFGDSGGRLMGRRVTMTIIPTGDR